MSCFFEPWLSSMYISSTVLQMNVCFLSSQHGGVWWLLIDGWTPQRLYVCVIFIFLLLPNRVEWSSNFCNFRKRGLCCRSGYFYESNSNRSANLGARAFSFSKSRRDQNEYIFQKILKYFRITSKNNRHETKVRKKTFNIFVNPPNWANWFLTWSKEFVLSLSSFLAFNKTKKDIRGPSVAGLKK